MTALIKNLDPEVVETFGGESHPAYCIDHAVRVWLSFQQQFNRGLISRLPPIPLGSSVGSGGRSTWWDQHGSYYYTLVRDCYPANVGHIGTPGRSADYHIGWNAGADSVDYLVGDGIYQFSVATHVSGVVTGFNDQVEGTSYADIDHGLYFTGGTFVVVEQGHQKTLPAVYVASDVFTIRRLGSRIRYFQNSTPVYQSNLPSADRAYADASLYFGGDRLDDALLSDTISNPFGDLGDPVPGWAGDPVPGDPPPGDPYPDDWPDHPGDPGSRVHGNLGDFVTGGGATGSGSIYGDLGEIITNAVLAPTAGVVHGDLGDILTFAGGDGIGDVGGVVRGNLGELVTAAIGSLVGPTAGVVAGDLGEFVTFAVALESGAGFVRGNLGDIETHAESGLFQPNFAAVAGNLGEMQTFILGLNGVIGTVASNLGELVTFASDNSHRGIIRGDLGEIETWAFDSDTLPQNMYGFVSLGHPGVFGIMTSRQQPAGGVVRIPMPTVSGRFAARGARPSDVGGGIKVPMPTVAGVMTATALMRGAFSVPTPTVAGVATATRQMRGAFSIPKPTVSGRFASRSSVDDSTGQGGIHVPKPIVSGIMTGGKALHGRLDVPMWTVAGSMLGGSVMRGQFSVPMWRFGSGAKGAFEFPRLTVEGVISAVLVGGITHEGYSITMVPRERGGIDTFTTRITDSPFEAIVRWRDRYYGIASDGIYELAGDTFDGEPIVAVMRTHPIGTPTLQRPRALFLSGRVGGDFAGGVVVGESVENIVGYQPAQTVGLRNHRIKLPRGVKSSYLAYELTNTGGEDFQLDAIAPENDVLRRTLGGTTGVSSGGFVKGNLED